MKEKIYRIIMILLPILVVVGFFMIIFETDVFLFAIWGVVFSLLAIIGLLLSDKKNKGIKITIYCIGVFLALYSLISKYYS